MKVLVTGGAGFIGSNLVERLLTINCEVIVLDDFSTGNRSNLEGYDIEIVEDSVLNQSRLKSVSKNVDSIVHLAALGSVSRSIRDPRSTHLTNVEGTLNILDTARERGLYTIFSSSSSVYGSVRTQPKNEELPTRPLSPYAASKLSAESYFFAYQNVYSLETLVLRFFNVFGPKQSFGHPYAAVIPNFLQALSSNLPIPLEGDGSQTRDFTNVTNVVDSLAEALNKKITHSTPVNLAFGEKISIIDLIHKLEVIVGRSLPINYLPRRNGDVDNSQSDPNLFHSIFSEVEPITFDKALKITFEWFMKYQKLKNI